MSKIYKLISIINLDRETQLQVLKIRNEESIRRWMLTENEINIDEHFSWIESLKIDKNHICFIIIDEDFQPIGAINIKKIDKKNRNAEIGFYKIQNHSEKGLMVKCLSSVIDYSFNNLELEKIYSETIEGNQKSYDMHKKLLFTEEGYLRSHIIIQGKYTGIYLFGLLKNEWVNGKNNCTTRNDIFIEIGNV